MNEAEAQFQSGMAMLGGNALSPDWKSAAGLIDAAADAGHADAIERRALLECIGADRARSWDIALDSLAIAAERGSQSAARQLILLADDQYEAAAPAMSPPGDWTGMRSRISLARRLQAPAVAGRVLSASPIVHAVPHFASASYRVDLTPSLTARRAGVYNPRKDPGREPICTVQFACSDLIVEMIRQRIANQIGAPLDCLEMAQVLHYGVGQEFVLHCDFLDPQLLGEEIERNGQRVATVLIYLNESFEGGETSFPRLGVNHRGKTGDVLVFGNVDGAGRPDPRSQHAGRPPISGEKWVFSQWVRNQAPNRG